MKLVNNKYGAISFHEDPKHPGVTVADESSRTEESVREPRERHRRMNISESQSTLGPGWVKIALPSAAEQSIARSFALLGFTESEARVAASGRRAVMNNDDSASALRGLLSVQR